MTIEQHRVNVSIGQARPPIGDLTLTKRTTAVIRLVKGLLAIGRLTARVSVNHFEDTKRWLEVVIDVLPHLQRDLFDGSEASSNQEGALIDRLQVIGNGAISKFLTAQRMSFGDLSSMDFDQWCSSRDLEVVRAIQSLPGKFVEFDDGNRPFKLGHPGLRLSTLHDRSFAIRCRVSMAGKRGAMLFGIKIAGESLGLNFPTSGRLFIPRDCDEATLDALLAAAKNGHEIAIRATPGFQLASRKVIALYLDLGLGNDAEQGAR
jgi:hypothetical protein